VPASQSPTANPLAAISMTRIQACGHLHVPAAANSSAAVAALTAIVEMMSFAIMSAPIVAGLQCGGIAGKRFDGKPERRTASRVPRPV